MKTFILALALAVVTITGCTVTGCNSTCQNAPKAVAKFAVGERVASTITQDEISVTRGDMGKVVDITYVGSWVVYWVVLEKDGRKVPFFQLDNSLEIEAVAYPDGALKP